MYIPIKFTPFWSPADEGAPAPVVAEQTAAAGSPNQGDAAVEHASEGGETGEAPKAEASPAAAPEPITMESLSLPEGFEISEEHQPALLEVLNDPSLSRAELVSKLASLQGDYTVAAQEAALQSQIDTWNTTIQGWKDECRALPEIGGANLDKSLSEIKRGLLAVGADEKTFAALDLTGAGSQPQIVAILHKLVKPHLERGPVTGAPASTPLDRANRMFPQQN